MVTDPQAARATVASGTPFRQELPVRAVLVPSSGAADVLQVTEVDRPSPGAGQLLVRVAVAGVNYMDVYQRSGAVSLPTPFVAGVEGVGTVAEIGDGVDDLAIGRRVGWLRGGQGSYAEYVLVDAAMAVPIPDAVPDDVAAAVLMQGVTAHYLATDTYRVQPGDTVLVHSAAGGVGQLLTQVVTLRGGRVIGTVSTEQKAEVARAAGAEEVLRYEEVPVRVGSSPTGTVWPLSTTESAARPSTPAWPASALAACWSSTARPAAPPHRWRSRG